MIEVFYGDWFMRCSELNWDWEQRFIISGSDSSDGIYPAVPGTEIAKVSGKEWSIEIEWNMNEGLGWQPSSTRRSVSYTVFEGLVIKIEASNDVESMPDPDYESMTLVCKSLDQTLNPKVPPGTSFDFTVSPNMIR